jgi:hypothetical protein
MAQVSRLRGIQSASDGRHIDMVFETETGPVSLRAATSLVQELVYKLFGAMGAAGKLGASPGAGATPAMDVTGYRAAPVDDEDVVLVGFQVQDEYEMHYALGTQDALALGAQISHAAGRKPH